MNKMLATNNIISSFVLTFLGSLLLFSCKQDTSQKPTENIISSEISISDAKEKLASGKYIFIDIRTPEEIEESGKVEGAIEMDFFDNEFKSKFALLDKNKPYVIYCRSGGRSGKTLKLSKKLGFKEVYDMSPGFSEWK